LKISPAISTGYKGQLRDVDDNRCLFGGIRQSALETIDLGAFAALA
jgi:hypothetical protein